MNNASLTAPVYWLDVTLPPDALDEKGYPRWDWEPPGWDPLAAGVPYDPEEPSFHWPRHDRRWFDKGAAKRRADLLRSYGATVTVIESEPIVWPAALPRPVTSTPPAPDGTPTP